MNPNLIISMKIDKYTPENDMLNFITSNYVRQKMAIICDKEENVSLVKMMLSNYGIDTSSSLDTNNVFLGIPSDNCQFDSVLYYYVSKDTKLPDIVVSDTKYMVINYDYEGAIDSFKMPLLIENAYYFFHNGFRCIAKAYTKAILKENIFQMQYIFSESKFYSDMMFMGFISQLEEFSYLTLYENFRLERYRDQIFNYIELNMTRILKEMISRNKLELLDNLLFDFNKEKIMNTAFDNELFIFDNLNNDMRYKLLVICDRKIETINKGLKLRLWTNLFIYQANIIPKDFFDLEVLAKEIEFTLDEKLVEKLFMEFDCKKLISIAVDNHFKVCQSLNEVTKETIFVYTMDDIKALEQGIELELWDYYQLYLYSFKHEESKKDILKLISDNFTSFTSVVLKEKNEEVIEHIANEFDLKLIEEEEISLCKFFSYDKRKEIYTNISEDLFKKFYLAKTWKMIELFTWYLENKNDMVLEYLNNDLMPLIQEISRSDDASLFKNLYSCFKHSRITIYAGNCNASSLFREINKEFRDELFEELCNDFSSIEAGIRLGVWPIVECYRFGMINSLQHDNIVRAISKNFDLFVSALAQENVYELMNQIIKDFDTIKIFEEAFAQNKNIFVGASEGGKEEIIKIVFDNPEYIAWLMKETAFNPKFVFETCERYKLDCQTVYKEYYLDILPTIEPSFYLALIVEKTNLAKESVEAISRRFHRAKGKKLLSFLEDLKNNGPKYELITRAINKEEKKDLTLEEMMELLNEDSTRDI